MAKYLDRLPARVRAHIWRIARTTGHRRPAGAADPADVPDTGEAADLIAREWLTRKAAYEAATLAMEMEEVLRLPKNDGRGCLAMTVSGSLLSLSRLRDNGRTAQYVSIGLRGDVPGISTRICSRLADDVIVGRPVLFAEGPIAGSSPVYRMARAVEDFDLENIP